LSNNNLNFHFVAAVLSSSSATSGFSYLNFGDSYSAECIYSDSDNGDDGSAPTAVVTSTVTMGMSSSDGNFSSSGNCYDGTAPAASATMVMTAHLQRRRQAASASGRCCQSTRTHARGAIARPHLLSLRRQLYQVS
jgi:hypothetical protein